MDSPLKRVLVTLLAGMLLSFVPSGIGAAPDDCGTTGDAGDSLATAVRLTLPVAFCSFTLEPGGLDAFAFEAAPGDTIYVEGRQFNAMGALYDPNGAWVADCCAGPWAVTHGGTWTIVFESEESFSVSHTLSLSLHRDSHSGSLVFGSPAAGIDGGPWPILPVHSVNGVLGPDASKLIGFDGVWIELPQTSTGNEWLALPPTWSAWFYDADARPIAFDECANDSRCRTPVGAEHVVLSYHGQGTGMVAPSYTLHYFW